MLPRISSLKGVVLGLLVLCFSGAIVSAESLRSNNLSKNVEKSLENADSIDCASCDNIMSCSLRQYERQICPTTGNSDTMSSCMTIYNEKGIVQQRGCRTSLLQRFGDYCAKNPAKCIPCDMDKCSDLSPLNLEKITIDSEWSRAATYECYTCRNNDCEDIEPITCNSEANDKRCFIQFEMPVNIISMGCISNFQNEEDITALIKQKLLLVCEGDKCNGYENIPQPNKCSSCSSDDEESCATNPNILTNESDCNLQPYTQCYQRVNNNTNGITERGCLSSLDGNDFWNCLTAKEDGDCKICNGNGCNVEIIPSNRSKCHRCTSSTDPKCEVSPEKLSVCPVYNTDENCVAIYDSGITKRGCNSEIECDPKSRFCQKCKGDGCNIANLKRRADELYGLFQDLPLNCYTCKGAECKSSVGLLRKCEGDQYQDCLTVFDDNGTVIQRGCEQQVLAVHETHCEKHPELCFNCKSNGCNLMTDAKKYQECLYCDSSVNSDCLFKPETVKNKRKCVEGCISSLYPRKTNPKLYDFARACLEDLELDDRPKCTAENNCVRCKDKNNCNTNIMPENRLSCLHCNGTDCNNPQSKKCTAYSMEDQCYMFFDNQTFSAVRMGCASELTPEQLVINVKQYFLCDGDDCNNFKNLPEAKVCFVCNSADDVNCAVNPAKIASKSRCQVNPYTECYSRINKDGHTERGCFYNMTTEDFIKCRNGDPDEMCKICIESECNSAIYPSQRRQCHRCNSTNDASCESNPKNPQPCPLYKPKDGCVTKLVDGITHRGCFSELTCEDSNRKFCKSCNTTNCNTVDLSVKWIGEPGQFQELPLNCHHCNGIDGCNSSSSLGPIRKCEGNKLQTCSVAFNLNGDVVARGCSDSIEKICEDSDHNCYDCKSNGCNKARQESEFIDCIFCDAQKGDQCVFEVDKVTRRRRCQKSCMTALYPRTNDKEPVYELIRTCLDDFDLDDREACAAGKDEKHCVACTEPGCNIKNLGERKSCYHCNGSNCQEPEKKTCRATMAHDQCFIEYDETGSVVEMGCKSKYDPQDVRTLLYAKRIWFCDEDNCNVIENVPGEQSCILCSSRTDPKCAKAPMKLVDSTSCNRGPYTNCYMRVLEDGHTERGCLSNLEDETFVNCLNSGNETTCMACLGENCNNKLYPANRRSCHICNSTSDITCEKSPSTTEVCVLYKPDEQCVTQIDPNGNTLRGCSSKLACESNEDSNCRTCNDDNCNRANLKRKIDGKPGMWQELPLSCHTCGSVTECAASAKKTVCKENEYCMTVFNESGDVETRGCSNAVESQFSAYCDENSSNCHNCNSNNCNTAKKLTDYVECIYCDSETNPDCVWYPEFVGHRRMCNGQCMTTLYSKQNSDVYGLTRSCLDDKDEVDRIACKVGDNNCTACSNGTACNTNDLPQDRWSCNVCIKADCEESVSQKCKNYKKDEQCFMLFGNDNSVLRMGCASDLDESFMTENIDKLLLCKEGSNCNTYDNIPQPKRCFECDSSENPDCASNPENVPSIVTCSSFPNTQCFTQVTDGFTKRGCISNLPQFDRRNCLTGNTTDCIFCNDNSCNKEIFPADRRRCHRCNSENDSNCEHAPTSESVCPFYSTEEFCSTKVVNGSTYRGCSSDFQCDSSDYINCRMCKSKDNCNTIDLIGINVGYPGKWQGIPLNCYICKGDECKDNSGKLRKCEKDNLQNCATIFNENGTVIQRGCSNEIYGNEDVMSYCDEHPNNCKLCKSHGCNTAMSMNDFVDCIFCDGTENANCVLSVAKITHRRSCHKKCMTGLYQRKDETNPAYELSRSCFDDLDLDDREACEMGKKEFCKVCEGSACNNDALPDAPRLKCNICNGDDCMAPKSHECIAYRAHDQCYALFENSTSKVLRMGCASDWDNSDLIAQKRALFLCDGDNCNEQTKFPKPTGCSFCNSNIFTTCATSPAVPIISTACDYLPYTQCYTRVDEGGVTHRGCLSDVSDDVFDECIDSESGKCKICDQNNCNTEVFPEKRRSCHRCDSDSNAACEDRPQEFSSICPVYNAEENCVTKIEGSRLLRGCATDFTCDKSNSKTCRICGSDNCNTVNLLNSYVGEPGRWQDLPLSCYTCEGQSCSTDTVEQKKCVGNNLQICMTVFGNDSTVQKRGCTDAVEETHAAYCEANPDKCLSCKSNGCNDAKSLNEYVDCYFCDSAEGKNCSVNFDTKTRTRKCHGGCMVALYPRSSVEDPVYELSRSCLDDMELDDRQKCENGQKEFCKTCKDARCNTMSIPEERHECFKCIDKDCEDFQSHECVAYHPNDQCFILYDNQSSVINMGCRSDLEMDVVTSLIKEKRLLLCDGKNCNSQEIVQVKSCLVCDSSDDPRCATNPNLVDNSERCSALPYTDCITRVNEAGHTIRGCIASLPSEEFYGCLMNTDGLCETCSKDNCNSIDIFPANRLRCHQCNSSLSEECESSPNVNYVCPVYDLEDSCVTNLRNGITYRGCSSNLKCYDESDKRNCRTCKSSGCNTVNLANVGVDGEPGKWQELPLTCIHCSNEGDCETNKTSSACENNIFQNCMTVFNAAGKVVERGCSDAVEANNKDDCETSPDMCRRCNSNDCNIATSLNDYVECLACDTDSNADCVVNISNVTATRKCYKHCMTAMYPREHEDNPAYHLTRSCWDDMELNDREDCAAGKKENCKSCDSAKCNTDKIPDKRLSCYICQGEGCQQPEESTCPIYRNGDQCYVLYDESHAITAMGCRSDFSNAEADFLLRQKRLYLCPEDNCNNIENLPKEQSCAVCSSRTDKACATNPETLDTYVECGVLPFTECYSRVLFDGSTERGCLSNLYDDEFLSCQSGNSSTCHACKGNICNKQVFPEGRARCHICDSRVDSQCEGQPNNIGICPQYDAEDTCLTVYRDGVTLRGCGSSLTCDQASSKTCSRCSGDGCNTINLAERHDDNYGKWQDLPLRCYVCSDNECKTLNASQLATCANNNEQDCVVVFNKNGEVIKRGCEDDVEKTHESYCDEHGDHCIHCKSNACNVALSLNEFNDCVYCDSHKDISCLWQPKSELHKTRKCRGGCMTALYPSDMSTMPAYDLIRTCLDDKEADDQTSCSSGLDAYCKACTGGKCNVDDLPENRISCLYCANGNCEDPKSMKCPLYKQRDQCYIWFDNSNSVSEMGCVSSFRNQELQSIVKTKRIFICNDGENCNTLDKLNGTQKCAVCDSRNDVLCATNAMAVGTFSECNMLPYTSCYSKLNTADGSTIRGCLTDLFEDAFADCVLGNDKNCERCNGDGCNREVYPADRQQCHKCTSLDDPDCESFPTLLQPCPVVKDTETCRTGLSGNETIRGCSSEVYCDVNDFKTCRSCVGTSCNSIDLRNKIDDGYHGAWQDLPLKCHTCSGEDCLSSLGPVVSCQNNIDQDCMTVFESDGNITRRGCSDAVDDYEDLHCRLHPDLCFKCKSNECNFAWSLNEYVECAFCNSTQNPACTINPDSNELSTRHCYKECMVTMKNNDELIRSCLDDKEQFNQVSCRLEGENGQECASCSEGRCNNFVFPSDRLACHVCTGSSCSTSKGQYCLKYSKNDFCFAKYEGNNVELMGCGSSQNQSDIQEWTEQNKLYRCNGSDCNALINLPRGGECISCDSTKTPNCAQNPKAVDSFESCEGPNNQCVTYINNGNTIRSCAIKLSQSEQDSCQRAGTCDICTGEKCNVEIFPAGRRQCHICNSLRDDKCEKSPNSLLVCPNYAENDRCVTKYVDNVVERGCATDLTCDTNDKQRCQICETDGCNTADLSGSTAITASLLFTSILAYIAIQGRNLY